LIVSYCFREQAHELSLELVVLQVMMPALLEQGHTREWLKIVVRYWCIVMAWILDLRSYLLGDVPLENNVTTVCFVHSNRFIPMFNLNSQR